MGPRAFSGIHAVLYAMFDEREQLDRAAMRAQVQACVAAGVDGIVVLGLATEVAKLSEREQRDVIVWAAEDVAGRVPLGVTIYGNAVESQLALLHDAERSGADWLILQPPSVGQYGSKEIARCFAHLAAAATRPVAIQNAPALMGRGLDPDEISALVAAQPTITHLKAEMPVLQLASLTATCGDRLTVLGGQGGLEMLDALRAGCRGFVLAPDMVDHAVRIWRHWRDGEVEAASRAYEFVLPEIVFAMRSLEHLLTYGKRIFARRAGLAAGDRSPCQPPTEFGLACVERYAAALGPFGAPAC